MPPNRWKEDKQSGGSSTLRRYHTYWATLVQVLGFFFAFALFSIIWNVVNLKILLSAYYGHLVNNKSIITSRSDPNLLVVIPNSQWFMWTILECKTWFVHWWNGGEICGKVLSHSLIHESKTLLTCSENFAFAICQGFKMHPKLGNILWSKWRVHIEHSIWSVLDLMDENKKNNKIITCDKKKLAQFLFEIFWRLGCMPQFIGHLQGMACFSYHWSKKRVKRITLVLHACFRWHCYNILAWQ
jgi:hypothetical protein